MKIVHIYSGNLSVFEDVLKGTGCCLNGSRNAQYLQKSFPNYNVRDVLGLIVFQQHITKRTLRLVKTFDDYFVFSPKPIVIVCDEAIELFQAGRIVVKNSPLYLIDSMDGTISDVDIERIFTTFVCVSGEMYDLRDVEQANGLGAFGKKEVLHATAEGVELDRQAHVLGDTDEILKQLQELGV